MVEVILKMSLVTSFIEFACDSEFILMILDSVSKTVQGEVCAAT